LGVSSERGEAGREELKTRHKKREDEFKCERMEGTTQSKKDAEMTTR